MNGFKNNSGKIFSNSDNNSGSGSRPGGFGGNRFGNNNNNNRFSNNGPRPSFGNRNGNGGNNWNRSGSFSRSNRPFGSRNPSDSSERTDRTERKNLPFGIDASKKDVFLNLIRCILELNDIAPETPENEFLKELTLKNGTTIYVPSFSIVNEILNKSKFQVSGMSFSVLKQMNNAYTITLSKSSMQKRESGFNSNKSEGNLEFNVNSETSKTEEEQL